MQQAVVALVFRCKLVSGDLVGTDETCAFRWATDEEVRTLATEAFAVRVLDAMHFTAVPAIRQHDGTRLLDG
jgi:hypothetical protein